MTKDRRLWMPFPIDIHRHPKIQRLPVEARWAFVEMNGEARLADNDGVFEADDAEFLWSEKILQALLTSHPTRPLIVRDDAGRYVIREFAKHQQTRAEREASAAVSRANGRKGGRPPKNPDETQQKPGQVSIRTQWGPIGTQPKAESESESELEIYKTDTSLSGNTPPDAETDAIPRSVLSGLGISPDRLITHIRSRTDREVTASGALHVASTLLERAGNIRTTRQQYVLGSITRSPAEVQQFIDENALTA